MSDCPDCVDLEGGGYRCCCCGLDMPAEEGESHPCPDPADCEHCGDYDFGYACCYCDSIGPSYDEDEC